MKCCFSSSGCCTTASAIVVTTTPGGSAETEFAPRKNVLFTNVRLAAFATANGASAAFCAGRSAKPSSVSPARLLKRHDSSVRFGNGSEANASNAARLRSSHHAGADGTLARTRRKYPARSYREKNGKPGKAKLRELS